MNHTYMKKYLKYKQLYIKSKQNGGAQIEEHEGPLLEKKDDNLVADDPPRLLRAPTIRTLEGADIPYALPNVYYVDANRTKIELITNGIESTIWPIKKNYNFEVGKFIPEMEGRHPIYKEMRATFDTGNLSITMISKALCDKFNIPIRDLYATDEQIQIVNMYFINKIKKHAPGIMIDESNNSPLICYFCKTQYVEYV